MKNSKLPIPWGSDPLHLISLNNGVRLSNCITASPLEIKWAVMIFRVPMRPTECSPALALKSSQANLLIAAKAPIRCFELSLITTRNRMLRRWRWWFRGRHKLRRIRSRRWNIHHHHIMGISNNSRLFRFDTECLLHRCFGRGSLFFLDAKVTVALGAKVHVRGRPKKPATISAENWLRRRKACALVLLRTHLQFLASTHENEG